MSTVLVLFLPSDAQGDAAADWTLVRDEAVIASGQATAGDAPGLPPGAAPERAVAVLPAQDLFIRRLPVPGRTERDARRAAPFLIEDQLAQPLDAVVTAIGPIGDDGARWVTAVDRERREAWRRILAGVGVRPVAAVADAMLLSGRGADLTAAVIGARVVYQARIGDLAEFEPTEGETRDLDAAAADPVCGAVEAGLAETVLPALGARLRPRRLLISEEIDPRAIAPDDSPIALKRMPAPDLRLAAAALDPARLADLPALFGDAFVSSLDWAELARPWRAAAGLAVAAALGAAVLSAGQGAYYDARAEAYRDAETAAFRQAFPEVTRVVNVQAQMRQQLAALGAADGQSGFLDLIAALSGVLEGQDAVQINAVRYDAERGALSVSALYSGFGDFEVLRSAAEARGVILEDGGARQGADGVAGDFTVRLP